MLKSERFAKTSSAQADGEDKSSGGVLSRKKSSAKRRLKGSQSESASSNAKNISESSDSENGPGRDAASASHSAPPKAKPMGKAGTGKRNSKRVAERVLVCMQKRQKKTAVSDSDSIVSSVSCLCYFFIDNQYKEETIIYHIKLSNCFCMARSRKNVLIISCK